MWCTLWIAKQGLNRHKHNTYKTRSSYRHTLGDSKNKLGRDGKLFQMRRDQERREDKERWATWQAARHHDWEDWTIAETMNDPGRVGKKQKVYVPAGSTQGRILWRSAARVKMQQQESRQIRFQFGEVDVAQEMSSSASGASFEQLQIPQDGEEEDGEVEAADDEVLQTASQTGRAVVWASFLGSWQGFGCGFALGFCDLGRHLTWPPPCSAVQPKHLQGLLRVV